MKKKVMYMRNEEKIIKHNSLRSGIIIKMGGRYAGLASEKVCRIFLKYRVNEILTIKYRKI